MSEKERMLQSLFPEGAGGERILKDVKFFPGNDREIVEEVFCAEVNRALWQMKLPSQKRTESIDGDIAQVRLGDILAV